MKLSTFLLSALVFCGSILLASEPATPSDSVKKPVLEKGDVERFIQTFPAMAKDFEALGQEFDSREDLNALMALSATQQSQAIFTKHGWDPKTFYQKVTAISFGYALLEVEKELANLSEQERAMVQSMMGAQMGLPQVHPQDLEKVRSHQKQLKSFFDQF